MSEILNIVDVAVIDVFQLKNLKIELNNSEYSIALIDKGSYEIVKGYGITIEEAMNDLHHRLL